MPHARRKEVSNEIYFYGRVGITTFNCFYDMTFLVKCQRNYTSFLRRHPYTLSIFLQSLVSQRFRRAFAVHGNSGNLQCGGRHAVSCNQCAGKRAVIDRPAAAGRTALLQHRRLAAH